METQKTPKSQNTLEKEQQSWRYHTPWFQTTLQSHSDQNSKVLAQKHTRRSMTQKREPRNKPNLHGWSINLQQRRQEYAMGERNFSNK